MTFNIIETLFFLLGEYFDDPEQGSAQRQHAAQELKERAAQAYSQLIQQF